MSSFQGLVRRNIVNTLSQYERLGYVSSNVANYNTTGYKEVRFEQILDENGYLDGVVRKNYKAGTPMRTDHPYDIAITGSGFVPVTSKTGDVVYTREGSFKLNKDGYLITNDNYLVGDGIKIPANYDKLFIKSDGIVSVILENGGKEKNIGKIPLVSFQNPEGLNAMDNNKYSVTANSGEPILLKNHSQIMQGNLELPNIDIYSQVNSVLRLNASMLASFKLMKTVNDMYTKAINLNQ